MSQGAITQNPCETIDPPGPEARRSRELSDEEIRVTWRAFEKVGWPFGRIAQLLLLTGSRRDEIGEARWSDINLESKIWTLPASRTKNDEAHCIPLSETALQIITGLPRIGERKDGFIFTTTQETPVSGWGKAKDRIDRAILEILTEEAKSKGFDPESIETPPHWVIHDLRRTAASGMAKLGIAPHVVEAVLNHKSGVIKGVAAVYNRYNYAVEKRQALDTWARQLKAIVEGEAVSSNVVNLLEHRV